MKGTVDEVIAALYGSAVDPAQWGKALEGLTGLADGRAANCFVHDLATGAFLEYRFTGYGPNWAKDYAAHYHELDLARSVLSEKPPGTMYPMHRYVSDEVVNRSEYYQDFYIREGLRYSCGGNLVADGKRIILAVHRPVGHQPYEASTVDALQRVLNHLPAVFGLRAMAAKTTQGLLVSCAALDVLPRPVCVVDGDLAIRYMNGAARSLFDASNAFNIRGNRLSTSDPKVGQRLAHDVKNACGAVPSLRAAPIHVPEGQLSQYEIQIVPLDAQLAVAIASPIPLAMLLLRRVQPKETRKMTATHAFDLTPAETAVAEALAKGLTPAEYAERRKVKISTVRSQIKSILSKTGCRRIAEVAMLFATLDSN